MSENTNQKIPILMYHSISSGCTTDLKVYTVAPEDFAEQMAFLASHNYTPINVTQLIRARVYHDFVLPERPVVITFDDGFADFSEYAVPVLTRHNFTATIYIVTDCIGGTSRWLSFMGEGERPMMTWDQVREVQASGIECGAHTHTHPKLDEISFERAREEIATSKKVLEDQLGQEVLSFAYPHGNSTRQVRQLMPTLGFQSACAVRYAMSPANDDPFALARVIVPEGMKIDQFAQVLLGKGESPVKTYARKVLTLPQYISHRYTATMKRRA